jgi:hypothetical protein
MKVRILSRKLARRGHSVTVLTVNLGSAEWLALGVTPEKTFAVGALSKTEARPFILRHGCDIALTVNPPVVGLWWDFVGPRLVRRSIEPCPTALWHAFGVDAAHFAPGSPGATIRSTRL